MMDRKVAAEEFARAEKEVFEGGSEEVVFGNQAVAGGNSNQHQSPMARYDGLQELTMMNQFVQRGLGQDGKKRGREEEDTDWASNKMIRHSVGLPVGSGGGGQVGAGVHGKVVPGSVGPMSSDPGRMPDGVSSSIESVNQGAFATRQLPPMMNGMPMSLIAQMQQPQQQQQQQQQDRQQQQQFFYPSMYSNNTQQQQHSSALQQQLLMQQHQQQMFFRQPNQQSTDNDGTTSASAAAAAAAAAITAAASTSSSSSNNNNAMIPQLYGYPQMATFPGLPQQQYPVFYVAGPQGMYPTPFGNMFMPNLSSMATLSQLQSKLQTNTSNHIKPESVGPQRRSDGDKRRGPIGKSRYRGVSWHKRDRKWIARVWIKQSEENNFQGRMENLGGYVCEMEAAKAVDRRKLELYGKDNPNLKLNFPLNNN